MCSLYYRYIVGLRNTPPTKTSTITLSKNHRKVQKETSMLKENYSLEPKDDVNIAGKI